MAKFSVNGVTYELLDETMTFAEARALEKVTGYSFKAITQDPDVSTSPNVLQAMLWVSMKRTEPTLAFSDLDDLAIASVEWEDDEAPDPSSGEDEPSA